MTSDWHSSDHSRNVESRRVCYKNGNLSSKALKRIFRDGVAQRKLPKRQKVAKPEPDEAPKDKTKEISSLEAFKRSEENLEKKTRL